jgi:hypothetical protein
MRCYTVLPPPVIGRERMGRLGLLPLCGRPLRLHSCHSRLPFFRLPNYRSDEPYAGSIRTGRRSAPNRPKKSAASSRGLRHAPACSRGGPPGVVRARSHSAVNAQRSYGALLHRCPLPLSKRPSSPYLSVSQKGQFRTLDASSMKLMRWPIRTVVDREPRTPPNVRFPPMHRPSVR